MWIDVRDKYPELYEEVLCMTRKFGHNGTKNNTPKAYTLLWWTGKVWEGWDTDDFENNPDFFFITHWLDIPEVDWK